MFLKNTARTDLGKGGTTIKLGGVLNLWGNSSGDFESPDE